jgi:hypothetical protein
MSETEEHCCEDWDEMSSHYHCARCGGRCSMMGHLIKHYEQGAAVTDYHMCCPDNCELERSEG